MSRVDAERCDFQTYSALITVSNDHMPDSEDDDVEAPSIEWVKHRQMILAERGIATGSVH